MRAISTLCAILGLAAAPALSQMKSHPVAEGSGPLRELSRNVAADSGPVYDPGRSISAGNVGSLSGNAVADATTGTLKSGPWSDISAGSVTAHMPVSGSAAPKNAALLLPPPEPVYDLRPLQQQLRAIEPLPREQASTSEEEWAGPQAIAEGEQPEIPAVEAPDAEDPGVIEPIWEPKVREPDVQQPKAPPVGPPPESVPIPVPETQDSDDDDQ